jgi:transcriptional regulator with XRE-family HTH domain
MENDVLERIKKVIEHSGLSDRKFSDAIGAPQSTLSSLFGRKSEPGVLLIQSILNAFADINTEWLLMGRGDMIKEKGIGHTTIGDNSPINGDITIGDCRTELEVANVKIAYLEKMLKDKEEIIELLKRSNSGR